MFARLGRLERLPELDDRDARLLLLAPKILVRFEHCVQQVCLAAELLEFVLFPELFDRRCFVEKIGQRVPVDHSCGSFGVVRHETQSAVI